MRVEVRLLGPVGVMVDGERVAIPGLLVCGLLARLALDCGRVVSADRLIDDLWAEELPEAPRAALHAIVARLRRALVKAGPMVEHTSNGYRLGLPRQAIDITRFEELTGQARAASVARDHTTAATLLGEALDLWDGGAMADLRDLPFVPVAARKLEEAKRAAVDERVDQDLKCGRHATLIGELEERVAEDPGWERAGAQLMLALYRSGRQADALRAYAELRRRLVEGLGITPSDTLNQLEAAILRQDPAIDWAPPGGLAQPPPAAPPPRRRRALPVPLTRFVGRRQELDDLGRLCSHARLVTITGAGGVGKSRLALEVAAGLVADWQADVSLVTLASVNEPDRVAASVAGALEVLEQPGVPILETVATAAAARPVVIVLDNCEHLIDACATVATVLVEAGKEVRVLATSREPLGIAGELVYRLAPLACPDPGTDADDAREADAVQLFVDRAQSVQPTFTADHANLSQIAKICRRLDGIPLAIELATGRLEALTLDDLADRLDYRFRLLGSGSRPALPQHKTLSATMDWSYGLLRPDEQAVLRRLAVFSGTFGMEAAEAVAGAEPVPREAILDALTRLVSKSMVVAVSSGGDIRYRLLETVREYAQARLDEAGDADPTYERLLSWARSTSAKAAGALRGPKQRRLVQQVAADADNYRAALERAVDQGAGQVALALAAELWPFWELHGHYREGAQLLAEVLLSTDQHPSRDRAWVLMGAGVMAYFEDRWDDARAYISEALEHGHALEDPSIVARALHELGELAQLRNDFEASAGYAERARSLFKAAGDVWGQAVSAMLLGNLSMLRGDFIRASTLIDESLGLARRLGDDGTLATALVYRGLIAARQGDHQGSVPFHEESLALARGLNNRSIIGISLITLGVAAGMRGEYVLATSLLEECLQLSEEIGERIGVGRALLELGILATDQGDLRRAEDRLGQALAVYREIDTRPPLALCLQALAEAAMVGGDHRRAAYHLGAADRVREELGIPVPPAQRDRYERVRETARAELGETEFHQAMADGQAWADRDWGSERGPDAQAASGPGPS